MGTVFSLSSHLKKKKNDRGNVYIHLIGISFIFHNILFQSTIDFAVVYKLEVFISVK